MIPDEQVEERVRQALAAAANDIRAAIPPTSELPRPGRRRGPRPHSRRGWTLLALPAAAAVVAAVLLTGHPAPSSTRLNVTSPPTQPAPRHHRRHDRRTGLPVTPTTTRGPTPTPTPTAPTAPITTAPITPATTAPGGVVTAPGPSPTTPPATSPSTTTPTTSTTAPALATCAPSALGLTAGPSDVASNQFTQSFTFANHGRTSCTLGGWPGFQVVDATGVPVKTTATRSRTNLAPAPAWTPVTLRPGGAASFDVSGEAYDVADNKTCPETSAVLAIPPDTTTQLRVAVKIADCGKSIFNIVPLVAGTKDLTPWGSVLKT